jgi:hypothetical protein
VIAKPVISLLEFFRTGQFGPLNLGSSKSEIKAILGEPTDWMNPTRASKKYKFDIWKYGQVEFHFTQECLDHFWCDTTNWERKNAISFGDNFDLDPWLVYEYAMLDTVELELRAFGLSYRIRPLKHETGVVFLFDSKTQMIFSENDETGIGLNTFGSYLGSSHWHY